MVSTISVITVSFNSAKTIEKTIKSVLNQRNDGFTIEYIIVDGNSKDETNLIIDKYSHGISKLICEDDEGLYFAMNKGLKIASGDVIGFLNSDDYYSSDTVLQDVFDQFDSSQNTSIVFGDLNYVNEQGEILRKWRSKGFFDSAKGFHPPHPAFYCKTKILRQLGGFNTKYQIAADYDLMTRALMLTKKNKVIYLPKVFVSMLTGGKSNQNISNVFLGIKEVLECMKKNNIKRPYSVVTVRLFKKLLQGI